ncbi:MAG: sugar ABC transporter substrate-binding protein [Treponema sp.]|jgi:ABC-type sugar transport system substrate-binding protein|nr:sugar ABC transporter substrate-binding protein [Treponema sp.]
MKKRGVIVVLVMLSALSMSLFARPQTADSGTIRLAYISNTLANPWCLAVKAGFEDACKELGVQALTIDPQYRLEKQISDLENVINNNYSGFTLLPIDENATFDLFEAAKAKGIATASVAQPQKNANLVYTLDEYEYGLAIGGQAGNWIRDNLGGRAKVALITQDNVEAVIARGNGVRDGILKVCPNVQIVSRQAGDIPEKGQQIIESVLQAHPDLNVVVATNDSGGIGGYRAMVAGGKIGNNRAVFSGDATAEALACMQESNGIYRGTVDLDPYKAGYDSAQILYRYVTQGIPAQQEVIYMKPFAVPREDLASGKYQPKN